MTCRFSPLGALAAGACLWLALPVGAQEEEPFWAIGRPKTEAAMGMAPIAAPPIATPRDQLPALQAPEGFTVEVFADGVLDARMLRQGDQGTVFVSSNFVAGKIYALTGEPGAKEVKVIASELMLPNGIALRDGALYVATPKEIMRFDAIEANLDDPPAPVVIFDDMLGEPTHGWKFIEFGPDGKLYYPVGAPCNICEPPEEAARIFRINPDGSGREVVAEGVRNTIGFDFHPETGELWFTDNQRDWLSEDMPPDELNRVTELGAHFGFPYCHGGTMTDPELGWGKSCADYVAPAATLGPHSAPLGMRFYDGEMFPEEYRNAIFIAHHGPWNRTEKFADVSVAFLDPDGNVAEVRAFLTGFVKDNAYVGRPVDVLVADDGALLVSDDYNGAVYRVSYGR
jgi:glucose/arabinose dehydrogenase